MRLISSLRHHPRLEPVLEQFRTEWRLIVACALIFVVTGNVFLEIIDEFALEDPFSALDVFLFEQFQTLRSPTLDRLMVGITQLGDTVPVLMVTLAVGGWLALRRAWRPLVFWMLAVGGGALINSAMKLTVQRPRPLPLYSQGVDVFSFPSGHTTSNVLLYGFLMVLLMRGAPSRKGWWLALAFAPLVILIGLSRLYLGAHWASDVAGGIAFALSWISLLAVFYAWRAPVDVGAKGLALTVIVTLAIVGGGHILLNHDVSLAHYQSQMRPPAATLQPAPF